MKKFFVLLAAVSALAYAPTVQAESFNQQSYDKVEALSAAVETFASHSPSAELATLATDAEAIQAKANELAAYDVAAEAPNSQPYAAASETLKSSAAKLTAVSAKMAAAARDDDESGFMGFKNEYNAAVDEFKQAAIAYGEATEAAANRMQIEQITVISFAVLTGILAIAFWLRASSDDSRSRARTRARRIVAIISLVPFAAALATLTLYLLHMLGDYWLWLPTAVGILVLLIAWLNYIRQRKRFTRPLTHS